MGVGIEVLVVDWPRVEAAPPDGREELLIDAAFGEVFDAGLRQGAGEHGWFWPTRPGEHWYGRYAFRDTHGSYTPHFYAGHRWDHLRQFADPWLRSRLDRFMSALFWERPEETGIPERPDGDWAADLLLWCPPAQVPDIAGLWEQLAPRLAGLREAFDRHAAEPGGEIGAFEAFARLLADWGAVVTRARELGWGVVGLRC